LEKNVDNNLKKRNLSKKRNFYTITKELTKNKRLIKEKEVILSKIKKIRINEETSLVIKKKKTIR
jgi:hypothetical protein